MEKIEEATGLLRDLALTKISACDEVEECEKRVVLAEKNFEELRRRCNEASEELELRKKSLQDAKKRLQKWEDDQKWNEQQSTKSETVFSCTNFPKDCRRKSIGELGGEGPQEGHLLEPSGVDVLSDGRVIVADWGNYRLQMFSSSSFESVKCIRSHVMPTSNLFCPEDVAVNKHEQIIVADSANKKVEVMDVDGRVLLSLSDNISGPCGVCVDENGNIYVSDYDDISDVKQVLSYDGEGRLMRVMKWAGFQRPAHISCRDGKVYVADTASHQVHIFSAQGEWMRSIGKGKVIRPVGVCVCSDGRVFVSEGLGCGRVTVLSPEGEIVERIGEGEIAEPGGIALSSNQSQLFVCDSGNGKILVF